MADHVRITRDTTGSPDGIRVEEYEAGETLQCGTRRMTERLAQILVDDGTAEWINPRSASGNDSGEGDASPEETKPDGPEETKPAGPAETPESDPPPSEQDPEDRVFEGGSYEASGSWKTFYDEDGWEIGNAQCSKDEAESWVSGEASLSDLKD